MSTDTFSYTVADDFSTGNGLVTVTVTDGSAQFVSASDDAVSTIQGNPILISPLGNDTFSPGIGPLVIALGSLTTPSPSGTAAIQANQRDILYSPASGFIGEASFDYDAQSSVVATLRSTAMISVQVGTQSTVELPSPLREITVNSAGALSDALDGGSALGALLPGDHVLLAAGTYTGNFQLPRNGTVNNPIVVRAVNIGQARLNGGIDLNGNDTRAWGLLVEGPNISASLGGARSKLMRCRFQGLRSPTDGSGQIMVSASGAADQQILFCDFIDIDGRAVSFPNDPNGARALRPTVFGCYFADSADRTVQVREAIQVGRTDHNGEGSRYEMGALIQFCLFRNYNLNSSENETVSVKSSGNVVRDCTFDATRFLTVRHGRNNRFERTRHLNGPSGSGIRIHGKNNKLMACHVSGNSRLDLTSGNISNDFTGTWPTPPHPYAELCLIDSCIGPLVIGYRPSTPSTVKARDNVVRNHTGSITTQVKYPFSTSSAALFEQTTTNPAGASENLAAARVIQPSQVGWAAPWIAPPR